MTSSRKPAGVAGVLAVIFTLSFSAAPLRAAEVGSAPPPETARHSLAAAAVAKVEALDPAETAAAVAPATQEVAPSPAESPAFFKTGKGIAVLLLLAGGMTATLISTSNDRDKVKSPVR